MPWLGAGLGHCGPAAKECRKPFAMAGRCRWRVLGCVFPALRTWCCGEGPGQGRLHAAVLREPNASETQEARAAPWHGVARTGASRAASCPRGVCAGAGPFATSEHRTQHPYCRTGPFTGARGH